MTGVELEEPNCTHSEWYIPNRDSTSSSSHHYAVLIAIMTDTSRMKRWRRGEKTMIRWRCRWRYFNYCFDRTAVLGPKSKKLLKILIFSLFCFIIDHKRSFTGLTICAKPFMYLRQYDAKPSNSLRLFTPIKFLANLTTAILSGSVLIPSSEPIDPRYLTSFLKNSHFEPSHSVISRALECRWSVC